MNSLREFGKFRLDTEKKILWHGDEPINLPLKTIELLCVLTESSELVTKEAILNRVWQDSFIEESNLTSHVYRLRKMFAKHGESEDLIKTIPKRGYRFTGEVIRFSGAPELILEKQTLTQTLIEKIVEPGESQLKMLPTKPRKNRFWIPLSATIIVVLGLLSYYFFLRSNPTEIKSLAVLPMKYLDKSGAEENLSLRLMDSIATKLSRIESISVRPTSSTLKFLNTGETAVEIGKKLQVDGILEGAIQRENNRLRVTLQLVSVKDSKTVWSEQFDGEADKLLELQDTISGKLLSELHLRLTKEQETKFVQRPTINSEAYEEYLKGRFFWNKRTPESLKSAITSFEKAIKLDPNFADAYIGLADSYYLLFDYSYDTSPKNVEFAKQNLIKAIQLNPNMADAYTTLGLIHSTFDWNWKAAEESLLKAKALAPNSANAHHRYGVLLSKLRRFREAESEMRRAKELDPTSTSINMNLGFVLMHSKKNDEAIEQLRKTLELDAAFISPKWYLARTYWQSGDTAKSLEEYVKIIDLSGDKVLAKQIENDIKSGSETTAIKNWAKEWEKQVAQNNMDDHSIAVLYSHLQNRDETLNWLEKSVASRHPWSTWINAEPEFDFVRDEPRFQAILKTMNLQ